MQFRKGRICLCILLTLIVPCFASSGKKAEEQGRPLLKAAEDRALFHADKNLPFSLEMKLEVRMPDKKLTAGTYSWMLTPDGDWRKETKFLDYADVEVNRGTSLWIKRSTDFRPLQAAWVEGAFINFVYLNRAEDVITHYSTAFDHHVEMRCVDLMRDRLARKLCFDPDGNLRRVEQSDAHLTYEYSEYRAAGNTFVPYKMTAELSGEIVFVGSIEAVSLKPKFDASLLTPPSDATKRAGCLIPSLPKLKNKVVPHYPELARNQHRQGTVTAYVLIASDGTVKNPAIIRTGGQDLDESVLTAIRQWQYEPAKCGDVSIDLETEVHVNFTLEIW